MPRTTSGRCAKIARALCQKARSSLRGRSRNATGPLPRRPEKLTQAMSYPRLGTRFASMPLRAPSHTTRQPESRRKSATARPGKTCPPVPPAMIMMVRAMAVSRERPPHELSVLPVNAQQDRERRAIREQSAAAEAHERKSEALGGQHAHVDAHVDERLRPEPDRDPLSNESRVRALEGDRLASDGESPQHQPREERDHREHEVGVRLGEIEELLDACAQTHAEPLAAAESDQRVRKLVAAAEWIGPGVHETENALHSIGRGQG